MGTPASKNHLTCQQTHHNHWHCKWHDVYRNINCKLCYLLTLSPSCCAPDTEQMQCSNTYTKRDEKARQIKQPDRAIIIATLPENKDPKTKPAWTNLSSHATCHLQTKKSKWWQIWLNIRITPQWKLTTHECWTTKHTTTGIVNLLYRQDIHQHEWRHDENCIRLPAHII